MKRSVPSALVGPGAAAGVPSTALDATACDAAFSSPPQWAATAGAQAAVALGRRGRA